MNAVNQKPIEVEKEDIALATVRAFFTENPFHQVNSDMVGMMTIIGAALKNPISSQEEKEKYYSYLLMIEQVIKFTSQLQDILHY